ncbi:TPA: IS3-like element ISKpn37 family transposase, partial [Escherichia coli]
KTKADSCADEINLQKGIALISRPKAKWPASVLCYYFVLAVTFITSGLSILLNVRKLNCQSVKAFNTLRHGTINRRAISQMLPQSGVDVSR